jgi:hypothetical protein
MKEYNRYKKGILTIFNLFVRNSINKTELYNYLITVEKSIKSLNNEKKDSGIWIKFFKGDTGTTTINNILNDLSNSNKNYIIDSLKIAINNPKEFQIYFS